GSDGDGGGTRAAAGPFERPGARGAAPGGDRAGGAALLAGDRPGRLVQLRFVFGFDRGAARSRGLSKRAGQAAGGGGGAGRGTGGPGRAGSPAAGGLRIASRRGRGAHGGGPAGSFGRGRRRTAGGRAVLAAGLERRSRASLYELRF